MVIQCKFNNLKICCLLITKLNSSGLNIAIVDDEISSYKDCANSSLITTYVHDYTCDLHKVSCRFINQINDSVAVKHFYSSFDEAYADARKGKVMGVIYFAKNFTESLTNIRDDGRNAPQGSFISSEIQIYMDKSDQQLTFFLEKKLRQTYLEFAQNLMSDCEFPIKLGNIPIDFLTPIYGSYDGTYTDYMAPGVVMT